jgi:hypothetical protein
LELRSNRSVGAVDQFIRLLKKSPSGAVFNPWWQVDKENDIGPDAPRIRREQLCAYLLGRAKKVCLIVIGEALGYRGGHFTGIAMTSERMLLGEKIAGIGPQLLVPGINPRRTSKPQICPKGFSEPTATIVWSTLVGLGLLPEQFVLWNAFPWHSFDSRAGMLSNRTPNQRERLAGLPLLKSFFTLFPGDQVMALGRVARSQVAALDIPAHGVRHPASGGARLFREQVTRIVTAGR